MIIDEQINDPKTACGPQIDPSKTPVLIYNIEKTSWVSKTDIKLTKNGHSDSEFPRKLM